MQRTQRFDFLDGHSEYVIADNATNFEASVRSPDFRAIKDLRLSQGHKDDFDYISPNDFAIIYGQGRADRVYTIEEHAGSKVLRVNQPDIGSKATLNLANAISSNGTWTADTTNSDATSVTTDTVVFQKNNGSVRFDTDVSQSANNRVTIDVNMDTAVNIGAFDRTGIIRMWLYVPEVTDDTSIYVESVELRWGSSSTVYWSETVSKPANAARWNDRWNLLEFNWRNAAETGTVDETAIDYLLVTVNYGSSQGDDRDFRINDIVIYNPKEMKMTYFSSYTAGSNTGIGVIFIPRVTSTGQQMLAPDRFKNIYAFAYNYYLALMQKGPTDPETERWLLAYKGKYDIRTRKYRGGELEKMLAEEGERIKIPQRLLRPQIKWN